MPNQEYVSQSWQMLYDYTNDFKGIVEGKTYEFLNRTVNTSLLVTHAAAEKVFEMSVCSDRPFSEEEIETWKKAMKKASLSMPSKRLLDRKFEQLHAMRERHLTAVSVCTEDKCQVDIQG